MLEYEDSIPDPSSDEDPNDDGYGQDESFLPKHPDLKLCKKINKRVHEEIRRHSQHEDSYPDPDDLYGSDEFDSDEYDDE